MKKETKNSKKTKKGSQRTGGKKAAVKSVVHGVGPEIQNADL